MALRAAEHALAKKAEQVRVLDLRKLSPIADFFVVCSGGSDAQVRAIAEAVRAGLIDDDKALKPWHEEGGDTLRWVLLDYVNVVVHVFQRETREYYALERFWGDADSREILDEAAPAGDRG